MTSIKFDHVDFAVRRFSAAWVGPDDQSRQRVLKSVNVDLTAGMRCALLGPNGSGKTTFLRLAAGIFLPSSGSISISGRVGAVIDPMCHVEPLLTGRRNALSILQLYGVNRDERENLAEMIGVNSGLGQHYNERVGTYSLGMQWKLALWTLLMVRPDVIVIDEGIYALDDASRAALERQINEILGKTGILLLATHSPLISKQFCNLQLHFGNGLVSGPMPFSA